jgi:hypothetical protein
VIDATPWGRGDAVAPRGVLDDDDDAESTPASMGVWPGAPIEPKEDEESEPSRANTNRRGARREGILGVIDDALTPTLSGAFIFTPVPVRPRSRGERRSLRTSSPGVSLRPGSLAFNPDTPRRLSTPLLTPFNSTPTFARMERPSSEDDRRVAFDAAAAVERRPPLALAHFANHPPGGTSPNVAVASVDVVFEEEEEEEEDAGAAEAGTAEGPRSSTTDSVDASLRPYLPNVGIGSWGVPTRGWELEEGTLDSEQNKTGGFAGLLRRLFGEDDDDDDDFETKARKKAADSEAARRRNRVVVPTLALVALEALQDEEVFLNYRLSTHVKRPEWYVPVDPAEDARRWASD